MRCSFCGYREDKVVDSRLSEDGRSIRRRRECLSCGRRFTTYEEIDEKPLMVVKRDGRREPFSREKLKAGISRACEKRPVSMETVDQLVDKINIALRKSYEKEVPSGKIGQLVMKDLGKIDQVAYVRFASVYRQFKDITDFEAAVARVKKEQKGK